MNPALVADTPEGRQFARFCKAFLRQSKGRWAGKPLVLEPWQHAIISTMLMRDPATARRIYTEVLLGLPRKNGKSTLCSAIALYFLIFEGTLHDAGAEVYSAAASKDQAKIVFSEAKKMVLSSPHLKDACQVYRDAIVVKDTGAIYRVLSADGRLQHGLNPSCVIIDELHAHRDPELYYALTTGSGAREEPLVVSITTAGHDLGSVCGEVYLRGLKGDDPSLLFHWLGVADDELDDHDAWKAANPASWLSQEYLVKQAKSVPAAVFQRLHLNRWTRAEELWLPKGAHAANNVDVRLHDADEVYLGVDMGRKHDTAAVAIIGPPKPDVDGHDRRPIEAMTWGAWPDPSKPPPTAHERISGDRIPFDLVEDFIRDCHRRFTVREVAFDPWRFDRSAETLMGEGVNMVEFPQTNERMAPASQGLFDAVVEGRLAHDGDPILAAHMEAATAKSVGRDVWRLDKPKDATNPSDAAFAMAMGLYVADADAKSGSFSVRFLDATEPRRSGDAGTLDFATQIVSDVLLHEVEVEWSTLDEFEARAVYELLLARSIEATGKGEQVVASKCRAAMREAPERAFFKDAA